MHANSCKQLPALNLSLAKGTMRKGLGVQVPQHLTEEAEGPYPYNFASWHLLIKVIMNSHITHKEMYKFAIPCIAMHDIPIKEIRSMQSTFKILLSESLENLLI